MEREPVPMGMPWRAAMTSALYGPAGFYTRPGPPRGGGGHFRTSAHASQLFATAMLRMITAVDEALARPNPLTVADIGAGGGHLMRRIAGLAPTYLGRRLRLVGVELSERPPGLPDEIAWTAVMPPPRGFAGVVLATEWLDNVPLEVAVADEHGELRYVLVEPATGEESLGGPVDPDDLAWAQQWWPPTATAHWSGGWVPGTRVELGGPRDAAWAAAVGALSAGLAITVDYGHLRQHRPQLGSLTGFYAGRGVPAVPDGSADITAHVAIDSARAAGEAVAGQRALLLTQRDALNRLGIDGSRPPIDLAQRDPQAYIRGLSTAAQAFELTDRAGLGGHFWVVQPVSVSLEALAG